MKFDPEKADWGDETPKGILQCCETSVKYECHRLELVKNRLNKKKDRESEVEGLRCSILSLLEVAEAIRKQKEEM